jgi:hypothetical protein
VSLKLHKTRKYFRNIVFIAPADISIKFAISGGCYCEKYNALSFLFFSLSDWIVPAHSLFSNPRKLAIWKHNFVQLRRVVPPGSRSNPRMSFMVCRTNFRLLRLQGDNLLDSFQILRFVRDMGISDSRLRGRIKCIGLKLFGNQWPQKNRPYLPG